MKGVYLAAPHGRLVHDGLKKAIAVAKPVSIEGPRFLCSKEEGTGLCYGLVDIGPPAHLSLDAFDAQFATHQVTRAARAKWWPDDDKLLVYPILRFKSLDPPEPVEVLPGTTMDMGDVKFLEVDEKELLKGWGEGGRGSEPSLVIPAEGDRIVMSSKEDAMPWTVDNPPRPAKNWTAEEKRKCVEAANAAIRDDPKDEQGAIFACIRAAGKTKHPGGKSIDPDDFAIAYDLVHGYMETTKAVWDTAYINDLPDSAFLYVESGDKDGEGKTVPRTKRHFPYKDASGNVDLPHLRNAIARIPQSNAPGLNKAAVQKKAQGILKNAKKSVYDNVAAVMESSDNVDGEFYLNALKEIATLDMILDEVKAGDDGDGETHVCTCPNCGAETDLPLRDPCREHECPKCGARLRGGGDETEDKATDPFASLSKMDAEELNTLKEQLEAALEKTDATHAPTVQAALDEVVDLQASRTPPKPTTDTISDKARAIANTVKDWLTSLVKPPPNLGHAITVLGRKDTDETWFVIWPTNAYFDREGEAFTTPSINDFVAAHEGKDVKGEAWVWHVPGSKFGTIRHQAVVADHFLCQLGTFDDTPIGNAFKEFFSRHPDGHPVVAPNGWGSSHGYNYKLFDRLEDGVYNWFNTVESSVLPVEFAANPFNPKLEVLTMNDKQRALFDAVGEANDIPNLADLIVKAGEEKKAALAGQEHKSLDDKAKKQPPEQVPDEEQEEEEDESQEKKPQEKKGTVEVPEQVSQVAAAIAERFQFDNLSKMLNEQAATIDSLKAELEATKSTLAERSQEQEVAAAVAAAPQYAWYQASKAAETVLSDSEPSDQELKASRPQVSETIAKIASKIG